MQSGISDYSEDLLPYLGQFADIDLFVDGYQPVSPAMAGFAVHSAWSRAALARYDAVIYQMGNSPAHAYIYRALLRHPGIVTLHEAVLHHLLSWMSWDRGDARTYINEFRYCYGAEGEALARRIILGQARVDFFDYPLSDRVIRSARGLIVHSKMARRAVLRVRPDAPVRLVPMGIPLPAPQSDTRDEARRRLGLEAGALVIGSFGHINPFKRLDVALRAFRILRQTHPNAIYVLVGSVSPNYDIVQSVRMLGLDDSVRHVGYADAATFQDYVAATDICINLRYPSAGETSASVLRLMGAGLPVLVSRTGAFEELPDGSCVKIDVDECEGDLVLEYLRLLAEDEALRQRVGANARRYVAEEHTMEREAQGYIAGLREWHPDIAVVRKPTPPVVNVLSGKSAPAQTATATGALLGAAEHRQRETPHAESDMLDMLAQAAAELGLGESDAGLHDAAQAWVELGRRP